MHYITFKRIFGLGFTNFWRNRWLSFVSTFTMTITLLVIGFFLLFSFLIGAITMAVKDRLDFSIFLTEAATQQEIQNLQTTLANRSDIKSVKFVSKEEALQNFKNYPISEETKKLVTPEDNPLPRSLKVQPQDPTSLAQLQQYLQASPYKVIISKTSLDIDQQVVNKLLGMTHIIKIVGWGTSIFFIILSLFVIISAVRLTIFTRKDEIEIMRLVGANNIFVKVPFVVEGFLYGLIAAVISIVVLGIILRVVSPTITAYFAGSSFDLGNFLQVNFIKTALFQLLAGVGVGVLATLYSVQKYIKI